MAWAKSSSIASEDRGELNRIDFKSFYLFLFFWRKNIFDFFQMFSFQFLRWTPNPNGQTTCMARLTGSKRRCSEVCLNDFEPDNEEKKTFLTSFHLNYCLLTSFHKEKSRKSILKLFRMHLKGSYRVLKSLKGETTSLRTCLPRPVHRWMAPPVHGLPHLQDQRGQSGGNQEISRLWS